MVLFFSPLLMAVYWLKCWYHNPLINSFLICSHTAYHIDRWNICHGALSKEYLSHNELYCRISMLYMFSDDQRDQCIYKTIPVLPIHIYVNWIIGDIDKVIPVIMVLSFFYRTFYIFCHQLFPYHIGNCWRNLTLIILTWKRNTSMFEDRNKKHLFSVFIYLLCFEPYEL